MTFIQVLTFSVLTSFAAGCAFEPGSTGGEDPLSLGKGEDGEVAFTGAVESTWMGRLRPVWVLGEQTCLLYVRDADQMLWGLIEPRDDCAYASNLGEDGVSVWLGETVLVYWNQLEPAEPDQIALLNSVDSTARYYHLVASPD